MASKGKKGSKKKKNKVGQVKKTQEKKEQKVQINTEKIENVILEKKEEATNEITKNEEIAQNSNSKEDAKVEEKPEEKTKKKSCNLLLLIILILLLILFSTIFAMFNKSNTNIVSGVKIKGIDISGLSKEQAKEKIQNSIDIELKEKLNIKYKDLYSTTFETEQIDFKYKLEEAINAAYDIGRKGNIVQQNYELLYTLFVGKNIKINYTYNEESLENYINDIESKLPGVVVEPTYYIEEDKLIINKGIDGIGIDKENFKESMIKSIVDRNIEEILKDNLDLELQILIIPKKANKIDIEKIYKDIYTEPKDAYYELEPFNIYPEVNGVDLKISIEEAKEKLKEEKEEYVFELKITPAEKTIKSFGFEAFPNLVSSFSTKYVASNKNRSKNLEIAAEKINGLVLMPGEIFSFNQVVGKRTVEEGYKEAKIYSDGAVVDGLAGGICQISSTLYNAALLANLEIVERRNHSFTTSYVPAGRDATVVYGITDFQFKNTRTYPIKFEAIVSSGTATFKIHSVAAEKEEYEVKIKPVVTQSIPYNVEYIPDVTLMPGQEIFEQNGQPGYKVTTYKELIKNGEIISNEVISNDTYKPMRTIIRKGP